MGLRWREGGYQITFLHAVTLCLLPVSILVSTSTYTVMADLLDLRYMILLNNRLYDWHGLLCCSHRGIWKATRGTDGPFMCVFRCVTLGGGRWQGGIRYLIFWLWRTSRPYLTFNLWIEILDPRQWWKVRISPVAWGMVEFQAFDVHKTIFRTKLMLASLYRRNPSMQNNCTNCWELQLITGQSFLLYKLSLEWKRKKYCRIMHLQKIYWALNGDIFTSENFSYICVIKYIFFYLLQK